MNDQYVTKEGLKDIKTRLDVLKRERRREIAQAIHTAKEQGDLSENAEYQSARDEQRRLESEIGELETTVKHAQVIVKSDDRTHVDVGDTVTLSCEDGKEKVYMIVGSKEANPLEGMISNVSPMGQALLGVEKGATVKIPTPTGKKECTVKDIK